MPSGYRSGLNVSFLQSSLERLWLEPLLSRSLMGDPTLARYNILLTHLYPYPVVVT